MRGEAAHDEFVERCYDDAVALTKQLDLDAIYMPWRIGTRPTRQIDENTFLYGEEDSDKWYTMSYDPASQTFGRSRYARDETVGDVAQTMRDQIAAWEASPVVGEANLNAMVLRAVKEHGEEYAVPGSGIAIGIPMQTAWLQATMLERNLVSAWLDVRTDRAVALARIGKKAGIHYINGGLDFADNHGPIYSPAFYREIMSPRWQRIMAVCREIDLPYVMRSDGNLWPVADELFGRVRPHGYGEIDWAAGMDPKRIREAFPELTLFGNVPCGSTLINGTTEDVASTVRYIIDSAAPRLVLGSSNAILHGTPPENVLAMFETAKSYSAQVYVQQRNSDAAT